MAVKTQWRAGFGGLIGLDYKAVQQEADRIEIELGVCAMGKIRALESWVLNQGGCDE